MTKVLCIDTDFNQLPENFRGRELPKPLEQYRISYSVEIEGVLFVELAGITGILFDFNKHFVTVQ